MSDYQASLIEGRRMAQRMFTLTEAGDIETSSRQMIDSGDAVAIMMACQTAIQMAVAVTRTAFPLDEIRQGFIAGWFANLENQR